jgi:hypothetical protein
MGLNMTSVFLPDFNSNGNAVHPHGNIFEKREFMKLKPIKRKKILLFRRPATGGKKEGGPTHR